jgi:hypothetical protein
MKKKITMVYLISVFILCPTSFSQEKGLDDPIIKGIGDIEIFEELQGISLGKTFGYAFSISPDESWIVTIDTYPDLILNLFHIPTRQKMNYPLNSNESLVGKWFPNCFSQDSSKIYFGDQIANISPSMGSLNFRPSKNIPRLENFEADFLNFEGFKKNRLGEIVKSWWGLDQNEGEFAKIAWNKAGDKLFQTSRDNENTYLVISSHTNNIEKPIDFSKLFEHIDNTFSSLESDFQELLKNMPDKKPEDLKNFLNKIASKRSSSAVLLDQLSISPNNKYLACRATIYGKKSIGFGGQIYGIIIPLEDDIFVAYPFSKNVYHKILWSEDSQHIYYYAQPTSGGGNGTIYRLTVSMNDN